jgi:flagellar biosynthesis protein FlhG
VNILLGIYPEHTIEDVVTGKKQFAEILVQDCQGIDIVPGSTGVEELANVSSEQVGKLIEALAALNDYDFVLFDTSAGISKNVVSFCMASPELLLVVTPEPTSLTDGYALLKILSLNGFKGSVSVIVNQISSLEKSQRVYGKFKEAVQKYLPVKIFPGGTVVKDPRVWDAVTQQTPFVSAWPNTQASKCINNIARYLTQEPLWERVNEPAETFWARWLDLMQGPLILDGVKPKETKAGPPGKSPAAGRPRATMPSPPAGGNGGADLQLLLGSLNRHLSSISKDMNAIRRCIEAQQTAAAHGP